jgi:hypothetical protein
MISLYMALEQIWTTDSIAASGYRARAPLSLFKGDVCSRMSEQVFVQLIAPSASCYGAWMDVSILLKMITNRENKILQICPVEFIHTLLLQIRRIFWDNEGMKSGRLVVVRARGSRC